MHGIIVCKDIKSWINYAINFELLANEVTNVGLDWQANKLIKKSIIPCVTIRVNKLIIEIQFL